MNPMCEICANRKKTVKLNLDTGKRITCGNQTYEHPCPGFVPGNISKEVTE